MESLMKKLLDAGYPKTELRHYCSSLFVHPSPLVEQVIDDYCHENDIDMKSFVTPFYDHWTGTTMLELYDKYNPGLMGTLQ